MFNVPSQSVIDYTYYLMLRPGADAALKSDLEALSASAPAPALYGPNHAFLREQLAGIVATLAGNLQAFSAGLRTDHLAALVPQAESARRGAPAGDSLERGGPFLLQFQTIVTWTLFSMIPCAIA